MSESLIDRIIRHEGFCEFPKPDAKGFWVIGYGHDISQSECDNYKNGIIQDDAMNLLEDDIARDKENCAKEFPWLLGLDDCRQNVIYEMVYQLGVGGVAQFKNMIAAIREKDWGTATKEMLASAWHKETPSRCEELANLMLNGDVE